MIGTLDTERYRKRVLAAAPVFTEICILAGANEIFFEDFSSQTMYCRNSTHLHQTIAREFFLFFYFYFLSLFFYLNLFIYFFVFVFAFAFALNFLEIFSPSALLTFIAISRHLLWYTLRPATSIRFSLPRHFPIPIRNV